MKIHSNFIPSISNVAGAIIGIAVAGSYGIVCHRDFGQQRFFNETVVHFATAHGFDVVTPALILGAIISLLVSFIVSHAVEKLWKK